MHVDIIGPNLSGADQKLGSMHVHRHGCRDSIRMQRKYGPHSSWDAEVDSVKGAVIEVYSDCMSDNYDESEFDDHWQEYNDLHFAPCCDDLPEE